MLDPATKKWEDQSTTKKFKFLFFCDCCAKPFPSTEYEFHSGFRPKIIMSEAERRARELIWIRDHESAYERANLDMFQNYLHRCEICGDHICGDCAYACDEIRGSVCCEKCLKEKKYHGIKMWEDE